MRYLQTTTRYISIFGVDFSGASWFLANVLFADCATVCSLTQYCQGFILYKDNGLGCWFKNAMTNGTISTIRDSYLKPVAITRTYLATSNFAGTQSTLFMLSNSLADCSIICDNILYCIGFLVDSNIPQNCGLVSALSNSSPVSNASSSTLTAYYVSTYILTTTVVSSFIPLSAFNIEGPNIGYYDITFDLCPSTCTGAVILYFYF